MNKRLASLIIGFVCVVIVIGFALAGSSANYTIPWDVLGRGGNEIASTNYAINSTVGQTSIGPMSSTNYVLKAGYWYGRVTQYIYLPYVGKDLSP